MTADFHQRMREIFDRAFELPEAQRGQFVADACGGDTALFHEVQQLLMARGASDTFMATGASPQQRIGRYALHGELGRGGMGIVYDAEDSLIGRNVALKVINLKTIQDSAEAEFLRERLFREARSCGRLSHPGIVIIFDVGQEGQSAFIAMELVEGPSLLGLMSRQRLQTGEALRILAETASALDHAHQHGIVHRDIKPGNIMVRKDGAVKVADFGIAKIMSGAQATMTSVIMGTPSYMSPEQIEGRSVDGRSDQFSLAVLAYELLAGVRPFRADSIPMIAHQIVYGERPSPRALNPLLPPAVDLVFYRAFAKAAEDRFATCSDFVRELQQAIEAPAPHPLPPPVREKPHPEQPERRASSLGMWAVAASIIVAALVLAYVFRGNLSTLARTAPASQTASQTPGAQAGDANAKIAAAPASSAITEKPAIRLFRVEPSSISTGNFATLRWDVAGADSINIDHNVGKVSAKDSAPTNALFTSTTFTLTASNAAGSTSRTAFIDVQPESIPPEVRARQLIGEAMEKRRAGDAEGAFALFSQAAELGNSSAMVEVGESYRAGDGASEDEKKALSWFQRAAAKGDASGMVHMGVMYSLGINGGDPDPAQAVEWFQKAAEKGDPAGLYNLAVAYENGQGVTRNVEKAIDLYGKSAALGNSEAKKRLSQLQKAR